MTLLEQLIELEYSLHNVRRKDGEWLEKILHHEFREITRSGIWVSRSETIESLTHEDATTLIQSSDFQLISLKENVALLHYRTFSPDGSRRALRTSCWICGDDGQWQLRFHQGTPEADGA